jgi:histidyl-tRNA synthetase
MGAKRYQAVKGTRDLLPPETALWAAVEAVARRVFGRYGFGEIRTPIFEDTELFARGVGESTDIVGKEMYSFTDKGGRNVTLRPESTASVCRAYVEHGMQTLPQPVRLFYIGPQFRYERPQKGRYRQFHQIGAELLGGKGAESDAEILLMLVAFLRELGFTDLKVLLNTVGDAESRAEFRRRLVEYLRPHAEALSEDSRRRLDTNPLRILDTKSPEEQKLLAGAPHLEECLTDASRSQFARVQEILDRMGVEYDVSSRLVRGLDYYTNTVFEIVSEGLGAQNAICGGGAYEGLVEELGGPATYGVGFAIGEDRLIEVLPGSFKEKQKLQVGGTVVVRVIGDSAEGLGDARGGLEVAGQELAEELRRAGVPAVSLGDATPAKTYAYAEHVGAPAIVVLGGDELKTGTLTVRTTATRKQETMPREAAFSYLKAFFASFVSSSSS